MTVLLWQITDYWLYLVVVLVFILVFKSHRHSLCLGFSAVKAACRQRMSYSRREFSVLISFIRLGLSLSSLSPSDHPVRPHIPLWRKIVKGPLSPQLHYLSLSLSISRQILPCYECAVQVHLVTQTSPVSRGNFYTTENLSIQNISSSTVDSL